jgi:transposase
MLLRKRLPGTFFRKEKKAMSLKPEPIGPIPPETVRLAKAVFPEGSTFMKMRDELGTLYQDEQFAALFPKEGQPALAPWRLALVTIMQFAEGLSDRQAAHAVRACLDWKYALGLELEDRGFDFSVLSEFRARLIAGNAEYVLFETLLTCLKQRGLVKARGRQRTDATHVLAAVRAINRVVCVGETMRAALNILAEVAPEWVRSFAPDEWYERYAHRVEEYRLPKEQTKRTALVETIGADGYALLDAIYSTPQLNWLAHVPAVEILRRVWVQQFERIEGKPRFRANDNIPPPPKMICSPYDIEATYGRKLTTWWVGYKVHLTESCDEDAPRLITHVETSRAGNGDVDVTPVIHHALKEKDLLPTEHLTDTNYAEAKQFVQSRDEYGIELIAPTRADHKWQGKEQQGFDASSFQIDWQAQKARCPAGKESLSWTPAIDRYDNQVIKIKFSMKDCKQCPLKAHCTKAPRRTITVRIQQHHEALQQARTRQKDAAFWQKYQARSGIEGTISQGVRAFGMRRSRYRGMEKTHLQHLIIATVINLVRVLAWWDGRPLAKTRTSKFAALAA